MGIFDFVKKVVKSVTKGISKVFSSVKKGLSRIADSDWGRVLLTGAAIFTGGMALSGGIAGWGKAAAAGEGFLGKFVGGAEGFVTALASPMDQAQKLIAGSGPDPTAMAANASAAGKATGAIEQQAISPAGADPGGQGMGGTLATAQAAQQQPPPSAVANASQAPPGQQPPAEQSWLEKAAGYAMDFVQSPVGAQMIQGYAAGKEREEEMEFEDRVRRSWQDPNNALAKLNRSGVGSRFISRGNIPSYNPGNSSVGTPTTGALPGEPISPGV